MMRLHISACCDCGLARDNNEDAILVGDRVLRDDVHEATVELQDDGRYVVAVCDGMGGHNAGEVASLDVTTQLAHTFAAMPSELNAEELQGAVEAWHQMEHNRLNEMAESTEGCAGMGTTLVSLFFYEGHVMWGNCGDSRLYRYRDGILVQLTVDHSLYNITRRIEDQHIITNSLGAGDDIPSYIDCRDMTGRVHDGDIFLLCSDGLYERVPDDELEHMVGGGADAAMLVMAACEFGTQDNVSAIVVKIEKTE